MLGLGSMFNHSRLRQNVGWKRDIDGGVVIYTTLRCIEVIVNRHPWNKSSDGQNPTGGIGRRGAVDFLRGQAVV